VLEASFETSKTRNFAWRLYRCKPLIHQHFRWLPGLMARIMY